MKTSKIINKESIANFFKNKNLSEIQKQFKTKNVYFLRHGRAEHNQWHIDNQEEECQIIDPNLVDHGVLQAKKNQSVINSLDIKLVFVSPLSRALNTAILATEHLKEKPKIIVTSQLREIYKGNTDMGTKKSILKDKYSDYNHICFDHIHKDECESGYLNIRKEKEITAFLYEFEEKMETPIYINCNFIEKNIPEELVYFIYSLKYQKNLQKLYYESKATLDFKKQAYCLEYMNKLHNLVRKKVELMTVYFLENFDKLADMHKNPSKYKLGQQSVEKTINNFTDMCIE